VDKGPEAFRTISEVADDLDLPQHVLRFWETRFAQIKPLKRGGGRRYYRPDDVTLLRGIKHLLYGEGYTIKGVQRILREQGPKHVMMLWQDAGEGEGDQEDMAPMPAMPEMFAPHRSSPEDEPDDLDEPVAWQRPAAEPPAVRAPEPEVAPWEEQGLSDEPPSAPEVLIPEVADRAHAMVQQGKRGLSQQEVRQLQLTLYELMECKEILDAAR
jgi:DNA-binding transcriptional MerR regulator